MRICRHITLAALAALLLPALAHAAPCGAYPYTLTNGQVADANQVMANFNGVRTCVLINSAASGANSDITSLSSLTIPLSTSQGGTGNTNGTAAAWTNPITLNLTGDATGSGSVNGGSTTNLAVTLPNINLNTGGFANANVTVNAKGQVIAASAGTLASGADVRAGVNATNIVTPASLTSQQSAANPGYVTLPGGIIIEWGFFTAVTNGSGTQALPLTFPNNFFSVVITPGAVPGTNGQITAAPSGTSALAWTWPSTVIGTNETVYWIATGN